VDDKLLRKKGLFGPKINYVWYRQNRVSLSKRRHR